MLTFNEVRMRSLYSSFGGIGLPFKFRHRPRRQLATSDNACRWMPRRRAYLAPVASRRGDCNVASSRAWVGWRHDGHGVPLERCDVDALGIVAVTRTVPAHCHGTPHCGESVKRPGARLGSVLVGFTRLFSHQDWGVSQVGKVSADVLN